MTKFIELRAVDSAKASDIPNEGGRRMAALEVGG